MKENRIFTERERSLFEQVCTLSQKGVLSLMRQFIIRKYGKDNMIATGSYIIAKGSIPVALVAHADTVFTKPPGEFFYDKEKNVMWSPDGLGADDRAGIYSIMKIVSSGLRPHVIITTDEESGCLGAMKLVQKMQKHPFDDLKFLIELDRRGDNDSVYYECANDEFEQFINPFGFETAYGTLSDISALAPMWGIAAVNFSIGYRDEHSHEERLYVNSMFATIEKVKDILEYVRDNDVPQYEYIEDMYAGYYRYGSKGGWNWNYDDEDWYKGYAYKDDGYNLTKVSRPDWCACGLCGGADHKASMLEIFYQPNYAFDMCNECYSKNIPHIGWCNKCNQGWWLNAEEETYVREHGDSNWVCRSCKEDMNVRGDSAANGTSDSVFTGSVPSESEYNSNYGGVAECEITVPEIHEWSSL